jgi:hypothetical protein
MGYSENEVNSVNYNYKYEFLTTNPSGYQGAYKIADYSARTHASPARHGHR